VSPRAHIRLRRVAVDGVPSSDLSVQVTKATRLELTAVSEAGVVSGYVRSDGAVQPAVLVVLVPQEESSNPYEYLAFQTDSDGSFKFTGVLAGDYVVFAVRYFADFEYANPAAVRPFLARGTPVHVEDGQVQTVHVELP
jgi:hypothetical protein